MNQLILKPLEDLIRAQQAKIQRELITFYQTTKSDPTTAGAGQPEAISQRILCGHAEIAALSALLDTARQQVFTSQHQQTKIAQPNQPEKK
jgi:hypothetical protein